MWLYIYTFCIDILNVYMPTPNTGSRKMLSKNVIKNIVDVLENIGAISQLNDVSVEIIKFFKNRFYMRMSTFIILN